MASHAASAGYPVTCPTCGAPGLGHPCRSLKTKRVTDTHRARIELMWATREAARKNRTS